MSASSSPFTDYFKGFEKVEVVKRIFGDRTEEILHNLRIEFSPFGGYMGVNNSNGHIIVNPSYLKNGDKLDIYLDVIHELVHVRQFMEGQELFDTKYSYVQRPTEIEAYQYAVEEAKRLGVDGKRICEYLDIPWIDREDYEKLLKILGIKSTR